MRIAIGADHGGYALKQELKEFLSSQGHQVEDVGAHALEPTDDYPDFTRAVAERVASQGAERGIMLCGSGVGASVAANKVKGVRASVCHDTYSAHQGVEHDDLNVLCLGARIVGVELARELANAFMAASYTGEERHQRRLGKVLDMESPLRLRRRPRGLESPSLGREVSDRGGTCLTWCSVAVTRRLVLKASELRWRPDPRSGQGATCLQRALIAERRRCV